MKEGKVYRRRDLETFSTAVDRDLSSLVETDQVKKLSGGLYYRPRSNAFGVTPPEEEDLVRAFLKTDDFLLTSYNHFNQLGLGLSQVYRAHMVYNHKRTGKHLLGGKHFEFRVVPAYPDKLSKEFLLVDLLNNLKRLPDNTATVLLQLKTRLNDFDREKVNEYADLYGKPRAKSFLRETYG